MPYRLSVGGPNIRFTVEPDTRTITISGTQAQLLSIIIACATAMNELYARDVELREGIFLNVHLLDTDPVTGPMPDAPDVEIEPDAARLQPSDYYQDDPSVPGHPDNPRSIF